VIIPVKESPSRREVLGEIRALNQLWRDYAAQFGDIRLVETPALTLDEHSNARGAYYREDDLHLNPLGYVQLECYVKPVLLELTGGRP